MQNASIRVGESAAMHAVTSRELATHTLISRNVPRNYKSFSKDTYNTSPCHLFTSCFPSKAAERGALCLLSPYVDICF